MCDSNKNNPMFNRKGKSAWGSVFQFCVEIACDDSLEIWLAMVARDARDAMVGDGCDGGINIFTVIGGDFCV